jgi:soluble lytic murein transglycosylase-like protein
MIDRQGSGGYPMLDFGANPMGSMIFTFFLGMLFAYSLLLPATGGADVYVYKDARGVLNFTNVPNHAGYRRIIRESNPLSGGAVNSPRIYEDLIDSASNRYGIDPDLVRAIIKVESDFDRNARSARGAMGLMQLTAETARQHHVSDVFDPAENIDGGVRHLRLLLGRYQGDLALSLAAYNAGSKAVEKHGGIPPFAETREYVRRVLRYYDAYRRSALEGIRRASQ